MKRIVIVQTVEYTSGIFRGKQLKRHINVYTEKQKAFYMTQVDSFGSPAKLIKAEIEETRK